MIIKTIGLLAVLVLCTACFFNFVIAICFRDEGCWWRARLFGIASLAALPAWTIYAIVA